MSGGPVGFPSACASHDLLFFPRAMIVQGGLVPGYLRTGAMQLPPLRRSDLCRNHRSTGRGSASITILARFAAQTGVQ